MNLYRQPSNYRQTTVNDGCPGKLPSYRHPLIYISGDGDGNGVKVAKMEPAATQSQPSASPVQNGGHPGAWWEPGPSGPLSCILQGAGCRALRILAPEPSTNIQPTSFMKAKSKY